MSPTMTTTAASAFPRLPTTIRDAILRGTWASGVPGLEVSFALDDDGEESALVRPLTPKPAWEMDDSNLLVGWLRDGPGIGLTMLTPSEVDLGTFTDPDDLAAAVEEALRLSAS